MAIPLHWKPGDRGDYRGSIVHVVELRGPDLIVIRFITGTLAVVPRERLELRPLERVEDEDDASPVRHPRVVRPAWESRR